MNVALDRALDYTWRYANGDPTTSRERLEDRYFEVEADTVLPPAGLERIAAEAVRCVVWFPSKWSMYSSIYVGNKAALDSLVGEVVRLSSEIAGAALDPGASRRLHCSLLRQCLVLAATEDSLTKT